MSSIIANEANAGGMFLRLPAELRVMIYERVFRRTAFNIYVIKGTLRKKRGAKHRSSKYLGILTTCRVVHAECKPIFYNNTTFRLHIKDRFWHEFMNCDTNGNFVLESFDCYRNQEPELDLWLAKNHWLQDSRSIVPIENARRLFLEVEPNRNTVGRQWTWTESLKQTFREASHIQFLHISLEITDSLGFDQIQTDRTLRVIREAIHCGGIVTGRMNPELGSVGFNSMNYYRLLASYHG